MDITDKDIKKIIADNIKFFRERMNPKMEQFDLGKALGYKEDNAQSRISQYENLKRSPNKKTLQMMAVIFGVQVADLMRQWDDAEYHCIELYRLAKEYNALNEFNGGLSGIEGMIKAKQLKTPGVKPVKQHRSSAV